MRAVEEGQVHLPMELEELEGVVMLVLQEQMAWVAVVVAMLMVVQELS